MSMALAKHGFPVMVDYTPSGADITGGDVKVVGDVPMVAHRDIDDGVKGALAVSGGVYKVTAGEAIAVGKEVFWDVADQKVNEDASGNTHFGVALEAASADGDEILVFHCPRGLAQSSAIASLTDSSGGSANNTIAAITQAANAGSADVGPVADAIADLAAKVNAILAALRVIGVIAT